MLKIACLLMGRVGNNIFNIVAAKKISRMIDADFIGAIPDGGWLMSEYIKNTIFKNVHLLSNKELKNEKWTTYPEKTNTYARECINIPNDENIILRDYFQDVKYVDKNISLKLFGAYDSIKDEIRTLYGDLSDYACLHVRRGDYVRENNLRMLDIDTINSIIKEHFKDTKIIVVSDDLNWCKQNLLGEQFTFADKKCKNSLEMDFYLLTQCGKGNFISNSTFSWWGAYLNENPNTKTVVVTPWFKNDFLDGGYRIIPDEWIKYELK